MRVCTIDIDKLVRIRRSFGWRWRLGTTASFLTFAYILWLSSLSPSSEGSILPRPEDELKTWCFMVTLTILNSIILLMKNGLARFFFGATSAFSAGLFTLIAIAEGKDGLRGLAMKEGASPNLAISLALLALALIWFFLVRYSYVLWLSLIPWGPGRALRQQVLHSLAAEAGRKKSARQIEMSRSVDKLSSKKSFIHFLTWGSISLLLAFIFFYAVILATINQNFMIALRECNISEILRLRTDFSSVYQPGQVSLTAEFAITSILNIAAYFHLILFSFLWHRWRTSRIVILPADYLPNIPAGGVVLLRHSNDDVMRIPDRRWTLSRIPFMAFVWNYTFEELIAKRLTFLGPLYTLGFRERSPMFEKASKWLSERESRHPLWIPLRRGVGWLNQLLPKRFPPQGGVRYRFSQDSWEPFIERSMSEARALVLIIGAAKNGVLESEALQREMVMIKDRGHLEKTVFLMPPLGSNRKIRTRWSQLIEYLPASYNYTKVLPKAKRILGLCFYRQEPVIITGSERTELFYESALDIAGSLVDSSSDQRGKMIAKYRPIMEM